jgi:regulator of protease activity HflC (stomatin/prohibitin superfamily)
MCLGILSRFSVGRRQASVSSPLFGNRTMTQERPLQVPGGWTRLPLNLVLLLGGGGTFILGLVLANAPIGGMMALGGLLAVAGPVLGALGLVMLCGHFTLQPNEARVLILFGEYRGTVRESGSWWTNPFMTKLRVSLRSRNLEGAKLKVNDKTGNPIEIAAVVVWRIQDTAEACFDVENYEEYVRVQSESAVRHLANAYAYDHGEHNEITLRSGVDEVSQALTRELQERLIKAGVRVEEARLTHLAYAPEIAQVMLRRQQAEAVIAAREKIVLGAVSMVQMALRQIADQHVVILNEERKAAMVSNLLVVLCSETESQPVLGVGSA